MLRCDVAKLKFKPLWCERCNENLIYDGYIRCPKCGREYPDESYDYLLTNKITGEVYPVKGVE